MSMVSRKRRQPFRPSRQRKSSEKITSIVKPSKTFSVLSDDFLQYLFELHSLFQSELEKHEKRVYSKAVDSSSGDVNNAEEELDNNIGILKKRFLKEISGKELQCICDVRISLVWESLLTHFNLEDFSLLLSRQCFTNLENIQSILFNKVGSRVFEKLLARCIFCCRQSGTLEKQSDYNLFQEQFVGLNKFWKEFVASVCSDAGRFLNALCDCSASHVLRSFILAAAGFMKEGYVVNEAEILRGAQQLDHVNDCFTSLLEPFWDIVDNSCEKLSQIKFLSHVQASLVLQSLMFTRLLIPARQSRFLSRLYSSIIGGESGKNSFFLNMSCDRVASHLLESLFYSMEDEVFQQMFDSHLRNEISTLVYDKYGNHVLQQIIKKQKAIPKVLDIFDQLQSNVEDIVSVGHLGVLSALAQALIPCEVGTQKNFVRIVAKALNCTGKTSHHLVRNLLYLGEAAQESFKLTSESISDTFEPTQNDSLDQVRQKLPKCSPVGSSIVQCILKYSASGKQQLEESFVSFGKTELLLIALDPSGSRAIESFLSSCENFSLLNRFIDKFNGVYSVLAKDCNGFHVLLRMFAVTDLKRKRKLVEELAAARLWLVSFPYGNQALVRLKVSEFVRRQEQWNRKETTMENRKRLFKDILEADFSEYESYKTSDSQITTKMKSKSITSKNYKDPHEKTIENDAEDSGQLDLILGFIRNLSK